MFRLAALAELAAAEVEKARSSAQRAKLQEEIEKNVATQNEERAKANAEKEKLQEEVTRATAKQTEEKATGPTSVRRSIEVQTRSFGTGTTSVASTQTDPWSEEPLSLSDAEVAKAAHRAVNRLAELSQLPKSVYQPSFSGHIPPPKPFRPPQHFDQ